ncbi:hypothetical protein ACCO45_012518 [Purpureocillium lilacinum]|uniref:Uncharacterized protein n=1 Tax=Purpureocillium lilacinum TaxID=33203 RepID=A0ACC4D872_PURLI
MQVRLGWHWRRGQGADAAPGLGPAVAATLSRPRRETEDGRRDAASRPGGAPPSRFNLLVRLSFCWASAAQHAILDFDLPCPFLIACLGRMGPDQRLRVNQAHGRRRRVREIGLDSVIFAFNSGSGLQARRWASGRQWRSRVGEAGRQKSNLARAVFCRFPIGVVEACLASCDGELGDVGARLVMCRPTCLPSRKEPPRATAALNTFPWAKEWCHVLRMGKPASWPVHTRARLPEAGQAPNLASPSSFSSASFCSSTNSPAHSLNQSRASTANALLPDLFDGTLHLAPQALHLDTHPSGARRFAPGSAALSWLRAGDQVQPTVAGRRHSARQWLASHACRPRESCRQLHQNVVISTVARLACVGVETRSSPRSNTFAPAVPSDHQAPPASRVGQTGPAPMSALSYS